MSPPTAGAHALLRTMNLSSVLRYLHARAPLSRVQLAGLTGLNKATISSLVDELLARGLIHEIGLNTSGAGRPATLLQLNPQAGNIIGVELGVDFIAVLLADFAGHTVRRWHREVDPSELQEIVITYTQTLVDEALAVARLLPAPLLGLGLTVPGMVDLKEGVLIFSPNLHWRNVPLRQIFHDHVGLPVFVDNDANAAALGEHLFGVARQVENFIFLFAGVGLGGGLFLNGELYRGAGGLAGEIGHTTFVAEPGRPCRCGHWGCWETTSNQYSVIERVRARLEVRRDSLIPRLMAEQGLSLGLPVIVQAAAAGDNEALAAFSETGTAIGTGIANLINIFNPEMVILGGALTLAGPYLMPSILETIQIRAMEAMREQVTIALSAFGPDASVVGAVAMVVEAILANPTQVRLHSDNI